MRVENLALQMLVAELAIEVLDIAGLSGVARLEESPDLQSTEPAADIAGDDLENTVAPDMLRAASFPRHLVPL